VIASKTSTNPKVIVKFAALSQVYQGNRKWTARLFFSDAARLLAMTDSRCTPWVWKHLRLIHLDNYNRCGRLRSSQAIAFREFRAKRRAFLLRLWVN
jgi:hypothetical protein